MVTVNAGGNHVRKGSEAGVQVSLMGGDGRLVPGEGRSL